VRSVSRSFVFVCLLALSSARLFSQTCTVSPTPSSGQAALPVTVGVQCPTTNGAAGAGYSFAKVDFGDGNVFVQTVGAAPPPSTFSVPHTYDRAGTFTVQVTATYSDSSTVPGTATVTVTALPAGPAPATGDIYISGTAGTIERRNPNGTLAQVLYIGVNDPIGGMGFNPGQLLHVTDATTSVGSTSANVYVFDSTGSPSVYSTFPATAVDSLAHSIAFDKNGNSYVGISVRGANGPTPAILQLNSLGAILSTQSSITNDNGSSSVPWLDLAADQCTVFYTLGGTSVLRFNFCTSTQSAPFATLLPGTSANEFRIRPNNEVLVANGDRVVRLDPTGKLIQTYALTLTAKSLVALSLDPDNASFWVGDSGGTVYKFDIQTGANTPLTQFTTNFTAGQNAPSAINGLTLVGELRAAMTPPPTCTVNVTPTSGLTPLPVSASGSCTSLTGPISSYSLFFGDGTNVAASSGTHTYTAPNTYTVTLQGTDSINGQIGSASQAVAVTSAVSCTLAMNPTAGTVPLSTTATANCSSTTGAVQNYQFDFGDGKTSGGTSATVSHQYTSANNFTVSLTATDASAHSGLASAVVNVVAPGSPFCTITVAPIVGSAPLGVSVNGTCFDPNANFSSGQISFGDGGPSFSFNNSTETGGMVPVSTTHNYELGGNYGVQIFASYATGSAFSSQIVKVAPFVPTGPPSVGDVYISGNGGAIETHKPDGTLSNILSVGKVFDTLGGMAFDASRLLYVADPNGGDDSSSPNVWLFDANGNQKSFTNNFNTTRINTIAFLQNGTAYIGGNGTVSGTFQATITAVDTSGNQTPFGAASDQTTGSPFVNFLDLAPDQCTAYYTLATTSLKRFNVCTKSQVTPDFNLAPLPGTGAAELRIRPNGEVLVADNGAVIRLDAGGNQVQTYGSSLKTTFYSLALDPDGRSFWTGDKAGKVYKFDIYTGQLSKQFATNLTTTGGITLLGEIRAATNPGPSCTLTVTPATAAADLPVTANGNCTGALTTNLDFGDGTVLQNTSSATHSYTSVGTFTVALTGTDANGVSNVVMQTVTVTANQPPTCTLTVVPTTGVAPLNVTATGTCTDPENDITTTKLAYGDGATQAATNGTHSYTTAGVFTVTVTATDVANQTATATQVVTVGSSLAPVCTLTVTPQAGQTPLAVTATGNCTGTNTISTIVLDYGDGATSNTSSGTHTYSQAGTFTVKLTATDAFGLTGSATQTVVASSNNFPQGVFIGVGGGKIMQFATNGTVLKTLDTTVGGTIADMAFDKAGNLYSVDFTAAKVSKFNLTSGTLSGTFGSGYDCQPETMVFDGAGNVYVGQQGCAQTILKFDPNGNFLTSYQVATEEQGSDDLALSADQCTMLYTSEGPSILRYDVCQKKQLAPFATGLNKTLELKILPDGGVLVADLTDIVRLNSSGQRVTTYTVPNQNCLYGIALDQDGTTFWADDYCSSNVDHIDINSGKVLSTFNTGTPSGTVFALAIAGSGLNVAGVGNGGTLTASPQSATLGAGQSATFTVTFTPNAAAAGRTLVLSCAGLPPGLSCSFNPPTITLGAAGTSSTATLTITRTMTAALLHPSSPWMLATWMGVVPAIVLMGFRSPRRRRSSMLCLALIVAATGIWASCGGRGSSSMTTTPTTPPGSYTIIVVGNASGVQASTTVNVTAQ